MIHRRTPLAATRPDRRSAITLIEVSATTATVIICLTLLGTSMKELRRESKDVRCLNNMSRIASASMSFAMQNSSEIAIPIHPLTGVGNAGSQGAETWTWGGKSGRGEILQGSQSSFENARYGTRFGRGPATRGLNSMVYKKAFPNYQQDPRGDIQNWVRDTLLDTDIFACPGDYGYSGTHTALLQNSGLTSYDHYGNSYAANIFRVSIFGAPGNGQYNSPFARALSRVPNPSKTYLYSESSGMLGWYQNYANDGCGGTDSSINVDSVIYGWHGTPFVFNLAFADGHVGRAYMNGHTQPQPDIGAYPPCGEGEESDYNRYHCVIIRGDGWQKDVMPALNATCFATDDTTIESSASYTLAE